MEELGIDFLIQEAFLGYKYRKNTKKLYSSDAILPKKLIRLYYLSDTEKPFVDIPDAFVRRYIKNELIIEEVHSKEEMEGQAAMYDFAHTTDEVFDIYSLLSYHRELYSKTPFPEYAGTFRNHDVYLPGTGTEITEWSMIRTRIRELDPVVNELIERSKTIDVKDLNSLFKYIDDCIKLKCQLVKIHPFQDGNGRTIRCFINRLFELAGIPPVYIKLNERSEYHIAMNKANCENDFTSIIGFYYYKICDSIVELDINERLAKEKTKVKE